MLIVYGDVVGWGSGVLRFGPGSLSLGEGGVRVFVAQLWGNSGPLDLVFSL